MDNNFKYTCLVINSFVNINILYVIMQLILISGDVSENPSPDLDQSNQNDNLSILHLNIRSIRNKLEYVKDNLSDFDILCFSETHLSDNVLNSDLCVGGFNPHPLEKMFRPTLRAS